MPNPTSSYILRVPAPEWARLKALAATRRETVQGLLGRLIVEELDQATRRGELASGRPPRSP